MSPSLYFVADFVLQECKCLTIRFAWYYWEAQVFPRLWYCTYTQSHLHLPFRVSRCIYTKIDARISTVGTMHDSRCQVYSSNSAHFQSWHRQSKPSHPWKTNGEMLGMLAWFWSPWPIDLQSPSPSREKAHQTSKWISMEILWHLIGDPSMV